MNCPNPHHKKDCACYFAKGGFRTYPENILTGKRTPETIKKMKAAHRAKYPPFFRVWDKAVHNKILRRRYLDTGIEEICVECGSGTEWQGKALTLHLDHKNGRRADNRLENLQFLCPNCHTQTPTYGWGNLKFQRDLKKREAKLQ